MIINTIPLVLVKPYLLKKTKMTQQNKTLMTLKWWMKWEIEERINKKTQKV